MVGLGERLMIGAAIVKILFLQAFALRAKDREFPVAAAKLRAKSFASPLALLQNRDSCEFAPDTSAEDSFNDFTIGVFLSLLEFGDKHRAIRQFFAGPGRRQSFVGRANRGITKSSFWVRPRLR